MEFKNIIQAELSIDCNDDKANLETILSMTVNVNIDNYWHFVEKVELPKKASLEDIAKIFENIKDKFLNKPKQIDYSDVKDPDDIPF